MDSKELKGLMEAYAEVCAPQEVDEAVKGASRHDTEMRKAAASERRAGIKPLPAKEGEKYAKYKMAQMDYAKRKKMEEEVEQVNENRRAARDPEGRNSGYSKQPDPSKPGFTGIGNMSIDQIAKMSARIEKEKTKKEEFDIFDIVNEFLQVEGIAETTEEAQWAMANLIDDEIVSAILDEATYSAKAARAGKDIGKPGKAFAKIAASAAKRYGSKERGKKVAGAVLAKLRAKHEE